MKSRFETRRGYSLIELMITFSLATFLITAVVRTYIACGRMMDSQRIRNNVTGSVRVSADYLTKDISLAGYGLQQAKADGLSSWVTWISGITNEVIITQGSGTAPDSITLAGAYSRYTALTSVASSGVQTITIPLDDAAGLNTSGKSLLYIGRAELARITAISGNQLTISTDPTGSAGLANAYPVNSPVELVKVYTYHIETAIGDESFLMRSDAAVPPSFYINSLPVDDVLAAEISDLQITEIANGVQVTLTGTSSEPDLSYSNPDTGHYRELQLTCRVSYRN